MKKRYFGTCLHFVRTRKGVPILNDVQVDALAQVKKRPGNAVGNLIGMCRIYFFRHNFSRFVSLREAIVP